MDMVIDIECLQSPEKTYVVKEVAIMRMMEPEVFTWTFKPPTHWENLPPTTRKQNSWIWRHFSHIKWCEGVEPYHQLVPFIQQTVPSSARLYCKGLEKCQFLSTLLDRPVMELGELGCPKSRDLVSPHYQYHCPHTTLSLLHRTGHHCAVVKCLLYAEWLRVHEPHDVTMMGEDTVY